MKKKIESFKNIFQSILLRELSLYLLFITKLYINNGKLIIFLFFSQIILIARPPGELVLGT